MKTTALADSIGKGLVAGFVGTLAIILSQALEMKFRGRAPSDSPAEAGGIVLGVRPLGEREKKRFARSFTSAMVGFVGLCRVFFALPERRRSAKVAPNRSQSKAFTTWSMS